MQRMQSQQKWEEVKNSEWPVVGHDGHNAQIKRVNFSNEVTCPSSSSVEASVCGFVLLAPVTCFDPSLWEASCG